MRQDMTQDGKRPAAAAGSLAEESASLGAGRPAFDFDMVERGVRLILEGIGEDLQREGLRETPTRVARMWEEITAGLRTDPAEVLLVFEEGHDEMVMVRDIPLYSLCEHHLLPFIGKAHVAYVPNERGQLTGLSKLARLVDGLSKRLQVQERLTAEIADGADAPPRPARGHGGDRGRAPLHEHARGAQARGDHGHLGRPRPVP